MAIDFVSVSARKRAVFPGEPMVALVADFVIRAALSPCDGTPDSTTKTTPKKTAKTA
jgi:hypothetical protein